MSFHVQWLKTVPRDLPWGSSPTLSSPSSLISLHCPIHTFHVGLAGFSLPHDHNRYLVLPGWITLLPPLIPHRHTPHHYLLLYFFNHSKLPIVPSSTYLAFVKSMPHSFNFSCVLSYNKGREKTHWAGNPWPGSALVANHLHVPCKNIKIATKSKQGLISKRRNLIDPTIECK